MNNQDLNIDEYKIDELKDGYTTSNERMVNWVTICAELDKFGI